MKYDITIDTGTSNTRAVLWEADAVVSICRRPVGVQSTATQGSNDLLKKAIRECITELLSNVKIGYEDVRHIIASGMITSNVGLVEIPHCIAPVGVDELSRAIAVIEIADICPMPIWFIPGVKNNVPHVTMQTLETMDIMRGEEVESIALLARYGIAGNCLLILPGSHTKFVYIDAHGRIAGCLTTLTGELLNCVITQTILSDAVQRQFLNDTGYDFDCLIAGYENAKRVGMARALFSGRVLNQFITKEQGKAASYLYGCILQSDIAAMESTSVFRLDGQTRIVIGGSSILRRALVDLLHHTGKHHTIEECIVEEDFPLSSQGALIIARRREELV
ncbi:2-dehydro-3-deoxygalactonokinase [Eubacteriales bacterium OttesenSCG-928-N14]|nr:2-dehydro-3-deoxygalactonokinase [Eubacteriales bacterium OttesenSCG-928-N14]